MGTLFLICAAIGGTVLVAQFVLTVIGLGTDAFDIDLPSGADVHADVHFDVSGDAGDAGSALHSDGLHTGDMHSDAHHVSSSWLFGVISFRTIVAAITFFGLVGMGGQSAGLSMPLTLLMAVAAGMAAMYGVYFLFASLKKLSAEGNVHIQNALGRHGTVYIAIPGEESGAGKIQLNLQNRTMEYPAMTAGPSIPSGVKVVVTEIVAPDTLAVEPILEPERNCNE